MQYFLTWLFANLFSHYADGYKAGYARAVAETEVAMKDTISVIDADTLL